MDHYFCFICSTVLQEPYIRCAECTDVEICTGCFSRGAECEPHINCHNYVVVHNDFELFPGSTWTANEEMQLLNALIEFGIGNWTGISNKLRTKSPQECCSHYEEYYLDGSSCPELAQCLSPFNSINKYSYKNVAHFKLSEGEDPPRFFTEGIASSMAGYNAARSDFNIEYDNYAEMLISDMEFDESEENDDHDLINSLKFAIIESYRHRVLERCRRKKIIRDHGLILLRKTVSWLHSYELCVSKSVIERLIPFMKLVTGIEFDFIMEGFRHEGEMKQYILRLQESRENGLTKLHSRKLFYKLLKHREANQKGRRLYLSNAAYYWQGSSFTTLDKVVAGNGRRHAPPLEIIGLPAYEKLTPAERVLCSSTRLVPESYLEYKNILVSYFKQHSCLRLAHARSLIKIDVNKTRKLYDFLVKEGYVQ